MFCGTTVNKKRNIPVDEIVEPKVYYRMYKAGYKESYTKKGR